MNEYLKRDCVSFREDSVLTKRCASLDVMFCLSDECPFYMNAEMKMASLKKCSKWYKNYKAFGMYGLERIKKEIAEQKAREAHRINPNTCVMYCGDYCDGLDVMLCAEGKPCSFYKTREMEEASLKKCEAYREAHKPNMKNLNNGDIVKACAGCGKEFITADKRGGEKYCCERCRRLAMR